MATPIYSNILGYKFTIFGVQTFSGNCSNTIVVIKHDCNNVTCSDIMVYTFVIQVDRSARQKWPKMFMVHIISIRR